jgi:hypothetical protein
MCSQDDGSDHLHMIILSMIGGSGVGLVSSRQGRVGLLVALITPRE